MIRVAEIAEAIDMSRVKRNGTTYKENETYTGTSSIRIAGRLLGVIGTVLMVVIVSACLSLVIPKIMGYDAYVVVSGSMEPSIPVGSIVYSEETDPTLLCAGNVIVFVDPSRGTVPITHRVVSNDTKTGTIITKGDANEREDINPVTYANVAGKVKVHIPRAGFIAAMLTSTVGKIITGLLLIEAWLLTEIGRRLRMKERVAATATETET